MQRLLEGDESGAAGASLSVQERRTLIRIVGRTTTAAPRFVDSAGRCCPDFQARY